MELIGVVCRGILFFLLYIYPHTHNTAHTFTPAHTTAHSTFYTPAKVSDDTPPLVIHAILAECVKSVKHVEDAEDEEQRFTSQLQLCTIHFLHRELNAFPHLCTTCARKLHWVEYFHSPLSAKMHSSPLSQESRAHSFITATSCNAISHAPRLTTVPLVLI